MNKPRETSVIEFTKVAQVFRSGFGVRELSFSVAPGEIVAVLGPSGCGKTTALRLAAGLEAPEKGQIFLNDSLIADQRYVLPPEQRKFGMVFQDYALFPHLNVTANVMFGMGESPNKSSALSLLEKMGLAHYCNAYPHMLSGGQQQRVAIARALASNPQILLMDEPFSGLDARLRDKVRDQTLHLLNDSGTAALIVTHDAEEAMYLADRIIMLRDGRVIQDDTPGNIYRHPNSGFVTRFFSEVNTLDGIAKDGAIMTQVGTFEAADYMQNGDVEVLIRPEAIRLENGCEPSVQCKISSSRILGWKTLVHLDVETDSAPIHLHCQVPGQNQWSPGQVIPINIDPAGVHVFNK